MVKLRLVPPLGKPIEIDKDSVLIGRELTCDIVLNDGSVSRRHAKIERIEGAFKITDQGSANGTFLDSQRITGSFLKNGQELRLGGMVYRVEVEEPDTPDLTATVAAPPGMADRTVLEPPAQTPQPPAPAPPPGPVPPPPAAAAPPPPPPRPAAPPPPPRAAVPPPPPPRAAAPPRMGAAPGSVAASVGTPVKKGKGPLFWILTGCCGCLLLSGLLAALGGGMMYLTTKPPADAAHSALSQLSYGDTDQVYAELADSLRASMTLEDFKAMIQTHPGLADFKDATFWNRKVMNDNRAMLSGVLTTNSGSREPITIELVKQGGRWRVAKFEFRSTSAF